MNEPDPQRVAEVRGMLEGMTQRSLMLESPCWACLGHPDALGMNANCEYCGGTGYTLTERGKELARFLLRHIIGDLSAEVRRIAQEQTT